MPRQLRIEYPGAMYHLMSRGNRREDIFLDDVDRQDFLKTLAEACQKTDWQVHAYLAITWPPQSTGRSGCEPACRQAGGPAAGRARSASGQPSGTAGI